MGGFFYNCPIFLNKKIMKTLLQKIIVLVFLAQVAFAQEEENPGYNQYSSSVFDSKQQTLNLVSKIDQTPKNSVFFQNKEVIVQQVGDFNTFNASLQADNMTVSALQNGNENQISLIKSANSIEQKFVQQGQNNTIGDYTYYTNYSVNTQMIQQGNNQSIQNYGTNSLSKDMKVSQTGNGASVIILNH